MLVSKAVVWSQMNYKPSNYTMYILNNQRSKQASCVCCCEASTLERASSIKVVPKSPDHFLVALEYLQAISGEL